MSAQVLIDRSYLEMLEKDSAMMECLDACGVVDWEGWDAAYEMYEEEIGE